MKVLSVETAKDCERKSGMEKQERYGPNSEVDTRLLLNGGGTAIAKTVAVSPRNFLRRSCLTAEM